MVATIGTGLLSVLGWSWSLAQAAVDGGTAVTTVIPAAALTATSGALVWVVKLIARGDLVHRDPSTEARQLAEALERTVSVAERAMLREEAYQSFLLGRLNKGGVGGLDS